MPATDTSAAQPPAGDRRHNPIAGILCLCAGASVFSLQDVVIKLMSGSYPLSQVLTLRGCVAIIPLALLLRFGGGGFRALRSGQTGLVLVRSVVLLGSYTTYYLAMASLPLAVVVALFFAAPLFIVLLSGPMLGEKVRPAQVVAVLVGFAGVIVICFGPGTGDSAGASGRLFDPAALMALASSFFYGISALLSRRLGATESGAVLANIQNVVYLGAAVGVAILTNLGHDLSAAFDHRGLKFLLRPWIMPGLTDFLLIASTGIVGAYGSFLLAQAYRIAEASVVAPFEYVSIVLAVCLGWLIWGEIPVPATFAGIALVIGAGIYVLRPRPASP